MNRAGLPYSHSSMLSQAKIALIVALVWLFVPAASPAQSDKVKIRKEAGLPSRRKPRKSSNRVRAGKGPVRHKVSFPRRKMSLLHSKSSSLRSFPIPRGAE